MVIIKTNLKYLQHKGCWHFGRGVIVMTLEVRGSNLGSCFLLSEICVFIKVGLMFMCHIMLMWRIVERVLQNCH